MRIRSAVVNVGHCLNCGACGAAATSVSQDGSVIFGKLLNSSGFRWTQATGIQDFRVDAQIEGASADGKVAIGHRVAGPGFHVVLWTSAAGVKDLGAPPEPAGSVYGQAAIAADGSTMVGDYSSVDGLVRGFRWKQATGFQPLSQSSEASSARSVSGDGARIVGEA